MLAPTKFNAFARRYHDEPRPENRPEQADAHTNTGEYAVEPREDRPTVDGTVCQYKPAPPSGRQIGMKLREVLQTYGLRTYAREAWSGRAVIRTGGGNTILESDGLRVAYTHRVEDVLGETDDWVALDREVR